MDSTAERQFHLTLGSRFENIELAQMSVDEALTERGVAEDVRHWVGLALREAVANAIKHGNRQDPTKRVTVDVSVTAEELEIRVADEGPGFDPHGVKDPLAPENRFRADGRGIFYMKRFMDDVSYSFAPDGGTVLTLRKRLVAGPAESQELEERPGS